MSATEPSSLEIGSLVAQTVYIKSFDSIKVTDPESEDPDLQVQLDNKEDKIVLPTGKAVITNGSGRLATTTNATAADLEALPTLISNMDRLGQAIQFDDVNKYLYLGRFDSAKKIFISNPDGTVPQEIYLGSALDNVIIQGTTTVIDSTTHNVTDPVITLNVGGVSPANSGILVESGGTNVAGLQVNMDGKWRVLEPDSTTFVLRDRFLTNEGNIAALQAQIGGGTGSLTGSRALTTNPTGSIVTVDNVTDAQVGYLSDVTGPLQAQIDGKLNLTGGTLTSDLNIQNPSGTSILRIGDQSSNGAILFTGNEPDPGQVWFGMVAYEAQFNISMKVTHSVASPDSQGHLKFHAGRPTDAPPERMRICKTGRVLIANSIASSDLADAQLHVRQTDNVPAFRVDDASGDTSYFLVDENGNVRVNSSTSETATETFVVNGSTRLKGDLVLDDDEATASTVLVLDESKKAVSSAVTVDELDQLMGVTAPLQTQLDGKQGIVAGVDDTKIGYLTNVTSDLQTQLNGKLNDPTTAMSASHVVTTDESNNLVTSSISVDQLSHLSDVTGPLQAQLDDKLDTTTGGTVAGDVTLEGRLNFGASPHAIYRENNSLILAGGGPDQSNGHIIYTTGLLGQAVRMKIERDGNVGIGTETPQTKLHVVGTVRSSALTAGNVMVAGTGGDMTTSSITTTKLGYLSDVTGPLQAQIDGKLSTSGGSLSGALTIGGTKAILNLSASSTNATTGGNYINIADNNFLRFGGDGANKTQVLIAGDSFSSGSGRIDLRATNAINFQTIEGPATEDRIVRMTVEGGTGNVGVGVTDPQTNLHVNGTIRNNALTGGRALYADDNLDILSSDVTVDELACLVGVTAPIQEQFDSLAQGETVQHVTIEDNLTFDNSSGDAFHVFTLDASIDPDTWQTLSTGCNGNVLCAVVDGNDVYFGGGFTMAGGIPINRFGKFNLETRQWSPIGTGMNGDVNSMFLDGRDLYLGGSFAIANGSTVNRIVKYNIDSDTWSPLKNGFTNEVYQVAVINSVVYAAGGFSSVDGVNARFIAKFSGGNWSALADGTLGSGFILTLKVIGDQLYAGGNFSGGIGGVPATRIAKYDPATDTWSKLGDEAGTGANGIVDGITSIGNDVYICGGFTTVNDISAVRIAKFNMDTQEWSALPGGGLDAYAHDIISIHTDIYVCGSFTTAGGVAAARVAKFDTLTNEWSALNAVPDTRARTLTNVGARLFVGGEFTTVSSQGAAYVFEYQLPVQLRTYDDSTRLHSFTTPNEQMLIVDKPAMFLHDTQIKSSVHVEGNVTVEGETHMQGDVTVEGETHMQGDVYLADDTTDLKTRVDNMIVREVFNDYDGMGTQQNELNVGPLYVPTYGKNMGGKFQFVGDGINPGNGITLDFDFANIASNQNVSLRYFRNTNTTGSKRLIFHPGNNTNGIDAQIGVGGTASFVKTGNFGVGTDNPTSKLHVSGDVLLTNGSSSRAGNIVFGNSPHSIYRDSSNNFNIHNAGGGGEPNEGGLIYKSGTGASQAEVFRIFRDGTVRSQAVTANTVLTANSTKDFVSSGITTDELNTLSGMTVNVKGNIDAVENQIPTVYDIRTGSTAVNVFGVAMVYGTVAVRGSTGAATVSLPTNVFADTSYAVNLTVRNSGTGDRITPFVFNKTRSSFDFRTLGNGGATADAIDFICIGLKTA